MLKTEIAESVKCEFCGRNLKQEKLIIIIGDVETKINKEVERCNCIQAKEFWKIQDYKRKKELELQEKREKDRRIEKLYDKIGNSLISTVVPLNGHEVLFTATSGEVGLLRIKN